MTTTNRPAAPAPLSQSAQRRLDRAARLRRSAARQGAVADAAFGAEHRIASVIPLGQPVLLGHHSERRHRRDLARIQSLATKGCEASARRDEAYATATRLERTAESAPVLSTDDDATTVLRQRLAAAIAEHAAALRVNKAIRAEKTHDAKLAVIVAERIATGAAADHIARCGYAYRVTNASAEVRRLRGRIEEIERQRAAGPVADELLGETRITDEDARTRILFPGKPSRETIAELKANGFRWSPTAGAWQRQATPAARAAARRVVGLAQPTPPADVYRLDGEVVDLEAFFRDNAEGLCAEDVADIRALQPGEKIVLGGGAAATFVLSRGPQSSGCACERGASCDVAHGPTDCSCPQCLAWRADCAQG